MTRTNVCACATNGSAARNGHGNFNDGAGQQYTYEDIEAIANYLLERVSVRPRIGIICGSGLGSMAKSVENSTCFQYSDIPNFPLSTVQGHAGNLVFGTIEGAPVVLMQGRFHFYEGYPLWKCVMPVRLMKLLGVSHLIASNAAGGANPHLKVGDIMLIKDHVNVMGLAGNGPLVGHHDPRFGPRFVPMSKAYDLGIIKNVKSLAANLGLGDVVKEGVYTCLGGPNFETIAEVRAMKNMGVDAIGMSTVHEIIAAKQCGLTCFAFSLITNTCVTDYGSEEEANSDEVIEVAVQRQDDLRVFIENVVRCMAEKYLQCA